MAGVAPNLDRQITRRLAVMHRQLEKVYAATGTRSIKQLKEFIILGGSRHPDDGEFRHPDIILTMPSEDNGISRELILKHPDHQFGVQQRFRVQHVNGKDHLVATEKIISDWELLNLILLKLEFPRQFIPEPILAELEVEHAPFSPLHNEINPRSDGAAWINSLPDDLQDEIRNPLYRNNWIDVEELFENANRLRELREWKRGLRQGPPKRNLLLNLPDEGAANLVGTLDKKKRSLLLNLPEEGPANLVGTFVTGARRMGGLRPGLHNLHIAGQDIVLILRLLPRIPDVRGVRLPDAYRNRQHYVEEMREHSWVWQDHLDRIFGPGGPAAARARAAARRAARAAAAGAGGPAAAGAGGPAAAGDARTRKRKTRNRKTRKNRK
jgi:hypothetical protein